MATPTAQMITITISVDDINIVLAGLGKLPYETSYQVLNEIRTQGLRQLPAASAANAAPTITDVTSA